LRHGLTLLNSPGTIDADYRGEVQVLLANLGDEPARIRRGDRIAQLVIAPVVRVTWQEADALRSTERGAGGFGSTEDAVSGRRGAGRGGPAPGGAPEAGRGDIGPPGGGRSPGPPLVDGPPRPATSARAGRSPACS